MKLATTLNRIRAARPCSSGWRTLLEHMGADYDPDAEINLLTILESNGIQDMLWCLRATEQDSHRTAVRLSIAFAERALPVFERRYPDDDRPRKAIQAARDFLDGKISADAAVAARAAADAADAAAAARAVAYAVRAAAYAAVYAVYAVYAAVDAAAYAASDAAYAASDAAEVKAQAEIIRNHLDW